MKKPYLLTFTLLLICFLAAAQDKPLTVDLHSGKNSVVYLNLITEPKSLKYFLSESNPDASKDVNSDANTINVYSKWLNPLRYKINWADELVDDPNEVKIKDFFAIYASTFGISLGGQKSEGAKGFKQVSQEIAKKKAIAVAAAKGAKGTPPKILTDTLKTPDGFNNGNLNSLYLQLKSGQDLIGASMPALNELTESLIALDEKNPLSSKNLIGTVFLALYKANNSSAAETAIKQAEDLDKVTEEMESITSLINNVDFLLKRTHIDNAFLNATLHTNLSQYLDDRRNDVTQLKALKEKIDPIVITYKKSLINKSDNKEAEGFYLDKAISFANGKILKSKLTIKEVKIDEKKMEVTSEADYYSKDFIFQRYESVKFFMSSGVFYSRTSLPGYGVGDNGGVQTVVQDDIAAKQAVTAVFGNLMFDIFNSRYFVPTIQLGADPTKKRPFVLAGGGFTIPAASLSLTMGAIWTWVPSLKTLKINGPVESTLALEKDIIYEFDPGPKGFYIGLQYNF